MYTSFSNVERNFYKDQAVFNGSICQHTNATDLQQLKKSEDLQKQD